MTLYHQCYSLTKVKQLIILFSVPLINMLFVRALFHQYQAESVDTAIFCPLHKDFSFKLLQ